MPKRRDIDVGPLPNPSEISLAEAMRFLDQAEAEAAAANKAAERAKARKSAAKTIALQALELADQEAARVRMENGQVVQYTPYQFTAYHVTDRKAFDAWAAEQDEAYYDTTPKLREQLLIDECRRRTQDGEELPPGVGTYHEPRISRTAIKGKG